MLLRVNKLQELLPRRDIGVLQLVFVNLIGMRDKLVPLVLEILYLALEDDP